MKRFTITQLLLVVTWCAIVCVPLSRLFVKAPYQGEMHDIAGTTFQDDEHSPQLLMPAPDKLWVQESPEWSPGESDPPVNVRAALGIADKVRRRWLHDNANWKWEFDNITLYPLESASNKWCWCVRFTGDPQGEYAGEIPRFFCFILMNGKVIVPRYGKYWATCGVYDEDSKDQDSQNDEAADYELESL